MLTARQRSRLSSFQSASLLTISTVTDWFVCSLTDEQLVSLYRGSCHTAAALRQSVDAETPATQQFLKEEELKQQLLTSVALRRNIPLSNSY